MAKICRSSVRTVNNCSPSMDVTWSSGAACIFNRAFNFVDINGWFHGRLYRISLHSRKKVSVKEINDQVLARRFRAFRFPLYGCNGLRCYFQVRRIPGILQKGRNCSYHWNPAPSCYQRYRLKSGAYFQISFTEFYQSSQRLFARFPE